MLNAWRLSPPKRTRLHTPSTPRCFRKKSPDVVFTCIPPGAHTTQVADAAAVWRGTFRRQTCCTRLRNSLTRPRCNCYAAGVINQVGYMARYSDITAKAKELVGDRQTYDGDWTVSYKDGCEPSVVGENMRYHADRWSSRRPMSSTSSATFLVMW